MRAEDPRLAQARGHDFDDLIVRLGISGLKRFGVERVGPCPGPGCGGDDRFAVNTRKGVFLCRICGAGGDQVNLVRLVRGLDFQAALDWLCGPPQELSEAERAEIRRRDAGNASRKAAEAEKFRAAAIADARGIWVRGVVAEDSPVRDYLALRGITRTLLPVLPVCLRYHPGLPYMVKDGGGGWVCAHRGPAMLAAIQGGDGRFSGVHRTWFDLGAAQGKIALVHPQTGAGLKRKKSMGSKKGGAIRLSAGEAPVMVMGEGIETTLSAQIAAPGLGVFWAGVDLGNMAGQRMMGQGLKYAGVPDMEDRAAFVPPPWVRRLIFIRDGDSAARETEAKLQAGLRRAMLRHPGLVAQIADCPAGADLNDVLLGAVDVGAGVPA